jgi:hypothetical protein
VVPGATGAPPLPPGVDPINAAVLSRAAGQQRGHVKVRKGTVELYPISYRLADLADVPRDELTAHLALGRIANDINMLRLQLMLTANGSGGSGPVADINAAAAIMNAKLLAGRLHEAWSFITSKLMGRLLRRLGDLVPKDAHEHRASLSRYFGTRGNLISRLRNKVSFHIDDVTAFEAVAALDPDKTITDYLSAYRGSVYYGGGWLLAVKQLQIIMEGCDVDEALRRLHDEPSTIATTMLDFTEALNASFLERHLGLSREKMTAAKIELLGMPDIRDATMPALVAVDGLLADPAWSDHH